VRLYCIYHYKEYTYTNRDTNAQMAQNNKKAILGGRINPLVIKCIRII